MTFRGLPTKNINYQMVEMVFFIEIERTNLSSSGQINYYILTKFAISLINSRSHSFNLTQPGSRSATM